mgnify:CR=1 FL=1
MPRLSNAEAVKMLVESKAGNIRDLSDPEQKAYQYSSGWFGPGYLLVKGLVGKRSILKALVEELAWRILDSGVLARIDFVAANATGGMVPGWILAEKLDATAGRHIPYVYVRNTRKIGGTQEYVTGHQNNPEVQPGMRALVFEELVNFAETTCNSARVLRDEGFVVIDAATIFYYANPEADKALAELGVTMTHLVSLPEFLDVAEEERLFPARAIRDYREYLDDPIAWNKARGFEQVIPK